MGRRYWKRQQPPNPPGRHDDPADFDAFWRKSLHDGWIEGTTFAPKSVNLRSASFPPSAASDEKSIEINFRRDPCIYDGQFSNNGWLQELPNPMSKMTW